MRMKCWGCAGWNRICTPTPLVLTLDPSRHFIVTPNPKNPCSANSAHAVVKIPINFVLPFHAINTRQVSLYTRLLFIPGRLPLPCHSRILVKGYLLLMKAAGIFTSHISSVIFIFLMRYSIEALQILLLSSIELLRLSPDPDLSSSLLLVPFGGGSR